MKSLSEFSNLNNKKLTKVDNRIKIIFMKTNKLIKIAGLFVAAAAGLTGCESAKVEPQPAPVQKTEEESSIDVIIDEEVIGSVSEDDEYTRSTSNVSVSKEVFTDDKKKILDIIADLDVIMKEMDYGAWVIYLDEESAAYWSRRANLQKAASRLPVKGLKLNSLQDYFKFVFVPSRAGHTVDEIRYETESLVKAVQVSDETDVVYYNFHKIDGKWKLSLPPIDN